MATYVNDLRLKEIGTGESSGTWGSETNTNLELIGEALGFGTEAITTNADTHTTTVADGSTDPGRAMYLKYTGTLDSACTITIAPNTMSRMHFIENGTSGSQNIIISQGTGANVTIPAGDVKAVYLDGAGSGAAVTDAFASLNVVDLKVEDDLTVTDDLIVNGDIDLEGSIDVNGTANLDVVDIDGAVDMASTLQVDGAITSSAGATITVADNSDNLTIVSTDADATTGPNLNFFRNSSSPADNDHLGEIRFTGRNDNSQDVVYANIETRIKDASDGTEDGYFDFETMLNGTLQSRLLINETTTVFNEDSLDLDFRVESNGNANMLFVDAGNDRVGIATASPTSKLHIDGAEDSTGGITLTAGAQAHNWYLASDFVNVHDIGTGSASAAHTWHINGSEVVRIDASGNCGINTSSPTAKLDVRGSVNSEHAVFTGGSNSSRGLSIQTEASGGQQDAGVVFDAQDTEAGAAPFHKFETAGTARLTIESQIVKPTPGTNVGSVRNEVTISTSATTVLNMGALVTSGDIAKGRYLITVSRTSGTVGTAASSIFGLSSSGAIFEYETINANSMTLGVSGGNVTATAQAGSYAVHANALPLSVDS